MKSVPDNEIIKVLRDRYQFDLEKMQFVNERDPRYNALFSEFVDLVQRAVNNGMDVEDALYRWIDQPLLALGLDDENDADGDLIANFKGDINLNIKSNDDFDDNDDSTMHENLDRIQTLSGIKKNSH